MSAFPQRLLLKSRFAPCVAAIFLFGLLVGCRRNDVGVPTAESDSGDSAPGASAKASPLLPYTPGSHRGFNLLLCTLDTVRRDHLGCYGHEKARTPVIDDLAARGVVFDHAISSSPSTLPSHSSIMTGLELPNHGVRTNAKFFLLPEQLTLAETLHDAGYATGAIVSTFVLDARFGLDQGFDEYDDQVRPPDWKPGQQSPGRTAADVSDFAIEWIGDHRSRAADQPFFFWAHYFDAHAPYLPPEEYAALFPDSPYDGEIAFVDAELGRLLGFLDEADALTQTLIVVIADHGEGLGEHGEDTHSRLLYDTTMRVPWIMSSPIMGDRPTRVDDVTVGNIDLAPTVLSMLGIAQTGRVDGVDLTREGVPGDRAIYVETITPLVYHGWASLHGLRRLDHKYIAAPFPELFDLRNDPGERHSLLDRQPEVAGALGDALRARMRGWPPVEQAARKAGRLNEAETKRLAALGYIVTGSSDSDGEAVTRMDPTDMVPIFDLLHVGTTEEQNRASRRLLALAAGTVATGPGFGAGVGGPPVREFIDLNNRPDDAAGLYFDPVKPAMAIRQAAILADSARGRATDDARYAVTLAIAQYRLGHIDVARISLDEIEAVMGGLDDEQRAEWHAYRAMTQHRLGERAAARSELGKADAFSVPGGSPVARAIEEARGLLAH